MHLSLAGGVTGFITGNTQVSLEFQLLWCRLWGRWCCSRCACITVRFEWTTKLPGKRMLQKRLGISLCVYVNIPQYCSASKQPAGR